MSILLNKNDDLRSGWKFAGYAILFFLLLTAMQALLSVVVKPAWLDNQLVVLAVNDIGLLVPALGAMLLALRFIDKRPLRTFGIGLWPGWPLQLLSGVAIGAAMLGLVIGGCYAFGYVSMRWTGNMVSPAFLVSTFVLLMIAAANEELIFRGFPLQVLIDGMGEWPAILLMSMLFGAMHWKNPNATVLSTVNVMVAGILLSLAYVRTRSLWTSYGLHAAWNIGLGFLFGFPVSGWDFPSLWTTGTAGSETILGGGFGPEGGLLATFAFGVAAVMVNKHGSINSNQASGRGGARRDHRHRA